MNKDIRKYFNQCKYLFSSYGKKEKEYLNRLKDNLDIENNTMVYDDIVARLGTPKEVFLDYISSQEESYLIDKINIKSDILKLIIIICAIALCLGLWKTYLYYKGYEEASNQKITEVEILPPEEIE